MSIASMKPLRRLRRTLRRSSGGSESAGEVTDAFEILEVSPKATNPALTQWLDPHLVAIPARPRPNPRLWLFLPGSYGRPQRQTFLLRVIARGGDFAVNLRYPNDWTIGKLANQLGEADAHEKLRLQVLDGRERIASPMAMQAEDAVMPRLHALLRWLVRNREEQAWSFFSGMREPNWERLAVAGHSQGGGHAAMLARELEVQRVVMLASPQDYHRRTGANANWLGQIGATPADRYYGFVHAEDPGLDRILQAWRDYGMIRDGGPVNVDKSLPPYEESHGLMTYLAAPDDRAHGSVAVDRATPLTDQSTPIYEPVWHYLFDAGT